MKSFTELTTLAIFLLIVSALPALGASPPGQKTEAIVFATFGTTVPEALGGVTHIRDRIQKRFPETKVKIAFTSNIIRKIWHKRRDDTTYRKNHPSIPQEIYSIKGPLATIADLQDNGYTTIVVQPGHITLGEEYLDLVSYINGLNSIETIKAKNCPFVKLVLGRPALGTMGPQAPLLRRYRPGCQSIGQ